MKTFLIWLIIDCIIMVELICSYINFLSPVSIYLALILGIISLFIMVFALVKKNKKLINITVAVLGSIIIAFGLLRFQDNNRLKNANEIITAVEKYKIAHQHYPDSLSQLTPNQLEKIPENHFGFTSRKYIYHKTGDNFDLKVETGKNTGMVWLSSEHAWDNYD